MKSKRIRFALFLIAAIFLVVMFCPYPSTTAPAWRVVVIDQSGMPVSDIDIREVWQYLDVDIAPWDDSSRVTDSQGGAQFPRRVTWASLARRIALGATRREDTGPSFFIQACDEKHLQEATFFWDGNIYWNPSAHADVTKLVAAPVTECRQID
jgi:hypothetical protein